MGFSVSGSAAIVFVGVMIAAGIAVPSLVGSFGGLAGAQGEQIDRGVDAANTEFEVWTSTYNGTADTLEIRLNNTGSTTLSVNDTTVLVDGEIPADGSVSTAVDGDGGSGLWLPGETLRITIEGVEQEPGRAKIVAENGIAETTTGFGG